MFFFQAISIDGRVVCLIKERVSVSNNKFAFLFF
jgi:hypothetical protein